MQLVMSIAFISAEASDETAGVVSVVGVYASHAAAG